MKDLTYEPECEASASPQPDALQTFKKNLIAHLIVLQTYTSLQLHGERVEFHAPLNAGDIEILVASLRHELLHYFTGTVLVNAGK